VTRTIRSSNVKSMPVVAEIDEARLVGWSVSPYRASAYQNAEDPLASRSPRTPAGIVSEADKGTSPVRRGRTSDSKPFVQHVVQECSRAVRSHACGEPSCVAQEALSGLLLFSHLSIIRRITPSVTRWSESSEGGVRIEVFYRCRNLHPTQSLLMQAVAETVMLMSRATRPEAVRTGKEVLLYTAPAP